MTSQSRAPTQEITDKVFALIQSRLHEPMKMLGQLKLYNGLDITQGRNFVKISCESYLKKILQSRGWMESSHKRVTTPMKYDTKLFQ